MKKRMASIGILPGLVALGAANYVLGLCGMHQACDGYSTLSPYAFTLFEPILLYAMAVFPFAVALLITSGRGLGRWMRFALWWLPVSAIAIALAPTGGGSWMPLYPDLTKESLAWVMGAVLSIAGFVLAFGPKRS
jgi:hypothetical protein